MSTVSLLNTSLLILKKLPMHESGQESGISIRVEDKTVEPEQQALRCPRFVQVWVDEEEVLIQKLEDHSHQTLEQTRLPLPFKIGLILKEILRLLEDETVLKINLQHGPEYIKYI